MLTAPVIRPGLFSLLSGIVGLIIRIHIHVGIHPYHICLQTVFVGNVFQFVSVSEHPAASINGIRTGIY